MKRAMRHSRLMREASARHERFPGPPAVSVLLVTFNQADCVAQALEGILAQKTSFGFELLVHDDCSTDGTLEILESFQRDFSDTMRLFTEERNRMGELACGYFTEVLAPAARGKYLAFCEGDDYWSDRDKLQHQFDYMEEHPDCAEFNHAALRIDQVSGYRDYVGMGAEARELATDDVILGWNVPTASRFIRKSALEGYVDEWAFDKPAGDFPLAIYLSLHGFMHYEPIALSVYRFRRPGSYSSRTLSDEHTVANARRWLSMLEQIDARTDGAHRNALAAHVEYYVSIIEEKGSGPFQLSAFVEAALECEHPNLDASTWRAPADRKLSRILRRLPWIRASR